MMSWTSLFDRKPKTETPRGVPKTAKASKSPPPVSAKPAPARRAIRAPSPPAPVKAPAPVQEEPKPKAARRSKPKEPKPIPAPPSDSEEALLLASHRRQIFAAAEAERKLGVALKALNKISEGERDPVKIANSALAELSKEKKGAAPAP